MGLHLSWYLHQVFASHQGVSPSNNKTFGSLASLQGVSPSPGRDNGRREDVLQSSKNSRVAAQCSFDIRIEQVFSLTPGIAPLNIKMSSDRAEFLGHFAVTIQN